MEDNIHTAQEGAANSLTKEEIDLMDFAKKTLKEKMKINCTGCRYCMPCPARVNISEHFAFYNTAHLLDNLALTKMHYSAGFPKEAKAANCTECGKCERHCPQIIAIREKLKNVRAAFE